MTRAALRLTMHRLAFRSVLALAAVAVAVAGLGLRHLAWAQTEPIRFVQDINNAFRQGTRTLATGYVERYDDNATEPSLPFTPMSLDYGPGRLAVATLWTRWVRQHVSAPSVGPDPMADQWTVEFYRRARDLGLTEQLCRPLLTLNLTGEALSAAAVFGLVRRFSSEGGTRPARAAVLGLVAAAFFWLDPAVIWNAHCWPQWDSWLLPFVLWAAVAASAEWWFTAGVLIAGGAMFKGQTLFAALWFVLWPVFQGRVGPALRWAAGLASGLAAATAVWDVRSPGGVRGFMYESGHVNGDAVRWVVSAAVSAAVVAVAVRFRQRWAERMMPPAWAGWVDRDPPMGQIAAAVAAIVVGLSVAAGFVAAGVWAIGWGSVAGGGAAIVVAVMVVGWVAWVAGIAPPRLPAAPWGVSIAARAVAVIIAITMVLQPIRGADPTWVGRAAIGFAAVTVALALCPARAVGPTVAGWVAATVLLCVPIFGGSGQWFAVGIAHGTTARTGMSLGNNNNLANLLEDVWHWRLEDRVDTRWTTLPAGPTADRVATFLNGIDPAARLRMGQPVSLPLKYVLVIVWGVLTAVAAVGAARHGRPGRRDPRFLLAVAAPWVAMFAVLGQMHQRYLLWGAALSCMAVAVSPGLIVPHLLLSVVSAGQEMLSMADNLSDGTADRARWRADHAELLSLVRGWTPGMGWAVLTIAGLFVYLSAAGRTRGATGAGELATDEHR